MSTGIYVIQNQQNEKFYLGSAAEIEKRWSVHRWHLKRGTHHSPALQRAWDKYKGAFDFYVIELTQNGTHFDIEQIYLDWLYPSGMLYNSNRNANGGGRKLSLEHRSKISEAQKRIGADTAERARRQDRADTQHLLGRFGRDAWSEEVKKAVALGKTTPEARERQSQLVKALWKDPVWRAQQSLKMRAGHAKVDPERASEWRKRSYATCLANGTGRAKQKAKWEDPDYKAKMKAIKEDPAYRLNLSLKMKAVHARKRAEASRGRAKNKFAGV